MELVYGAISTTFSTCTVTLGLVLRARQKPVDGQEPEALEAGGTPQEALTAEG